MGHSWLQVMFALMAVAPGCGRGHVPASEVPDAHGQAQSSQEESTAVPQEGSHVMPRYSSCMFRCVDHAMRDMLKSMLTTRARLSLMLNEGSEGEEHDFCWLLHLRSQKGERLTKAFVLLNPEPNPDGGQPPSYRIRVTIPSAEPQYVQAQPKKRIIRLLNGEACGVRYDVTEPFRGAEAGPDAKMCVKAVCLDEDLCRALRLGMHCPPFLATLWRSLPRPDG